MSARSTIGGLFLHRRPSAIAGRVSSVVVDALKRQSGGAVAHVVVKRLERNGPSLADSDATINIVFPLRVAGIGVASRLHALPRGARSRVHQAVANARKRRHSAQVRHAMAAAGLVAPAFKIRLAHGGCRAAIALQRDVIMRRLLVCQQPRNAFANTNERVDAGAYSHGFSVSVHARIMTRNGAPSKQKDYCQ